VDYHAEEENVDGGQGLGGEEVVVLVGYAGGDGGGDGGGGGLEDSIVSGMSWTMKEREGKVSARAMLPWPLEPPTWMVGLVLVFGRMSEWLVGDCAYIDDSCLVQGRPVKSRQQMLDTGCVCRSHILHISSKLARRLLILLQVIKIRKISAFRDIVRRLSLRLGLAVFLSRLDDFRGRWRGLLGHEERPVHQRRVRDECRRGAVVADFPWNRLGEEVACHRHAGDAFQLGFRHLGRFCDLGVGDR